MDGSVTSTSPAWIDREQLRTALDLSSIGTALTTLSGECLYVNRKLRTLCALGENLDGWQIKDLAQGSDRLVIEAAFQMVLENRAPSFEHEVRVAAADGSVFWGILSGSLVRAEDGAPLTFLVHLRDISLRKHAEEKLMRRDKRLRMALKAGGFADWEHDFATGRTLRGPLHDRIFGHQTPLRVWTIETFLDHVAPDDRPWVASAFARIQADPSPIHIVYRILRAGDGQVRWLESYAEPEFEHGKVSRLFGLVRDVTQEHEAELRLTQSEERYRLAAAAISEAVWDWDLAGDAITWSDALTTGFGHSPPGLVTTEAWWLDHIHPDDRAHVDEMLRLAFEDGAATFSGEYRFRRGTGEWAHVLDRAHVVRDASGTPVRLVGAMLDLTRRKRAEAELEARKAQLRTILETAPVGILMAELPSGAVVERNSQVEAMLKHPVPCGPSMNAHANWEGYHADGTRVTPEEYPLSRMALDGDPAPEIEVHYQRGDGVRSWIRVTGRPVHDEAGALVGGVVALVDIDAERRAKASLEALNRELESRVSQQVSARLKTEALLRQSQKLEAVGQLTGGVAHDFNNLLTVMIGSLEEITDRLPADHALQEPAQLARSAAERGADLTSQLLSFARRQPQQPVSIAVADLLSTIEGLVRRTVRENVSLRVEGRNQSLRLLADRAQLESAILNLCLNARDAMPNGGELTISATCTTLDPHDEASAEAPDSTLYCCLSVSDNGEGMDSETLLRAAEPFFTTKPAGQGTGLGLSMVYGFARQSGGEMRIRSSLGRGSTVSLYLPITDQVATQAAPTAAIVGRTARILVAEDNEMLRSQVSRQLEALGHTVTAAPDGRTALALLRGEQEFDLLFTDMVMPGGVGGDELAEAAHGLRPGMPVLITTGYADYFNAEDGVMRRVLTKPYRRAQLAAAIEEILAPPSVSGENAPALGSA